MPIEYTMLENAPEIFEQCPKCNCKPFKSFMRGMVQRSKRKFIFFKEYKYCAVICDKCKKIVGHESPEEGQLMELISRGIKYE